MPAGRGGNGRAWLCAALRWASREKAPCSLPSLPSPVGGLSSNLHPQKARMIL